MVKLSIAPLSLFRHFIIHYHCFISNKNVICDPLVFNTNFRKGKICSNAYNENA